MEELYGPYMNIGYVQTVKITVPLAASTAPVMAPLPMELKGSSFPRRPIKQQSNVENKPPHTAKLPMEVVASVIVTFIAATLNYLASKYFIIICHSFSVEQNTRIPLKKIKLYFKSCYDQS